MSPPKDVPRRDAGPYYVVHPGGGWVDFRTREAAEAYVRMQPNPERFSIVTEPPRAATPAAQQVPPWQWWGSVGLEALGGLGLAGLAAASPWGPLLSIPLGVGLAASGAKVRGEDPWQSAILQALAEALGPLTLAAQRVGPLGRRAAERFGQRITREIEALTPAIRSAWTDAIRHGEARIDTMRRASREAWERFLGSVAARRGQAEQALARELVESIQQRVPTLAAFEGTPEGLRSMVSGQGHVALGEMYGRVLSDVKDAVRGTIIPLPDEIAVTLRVPRRLMETPEGTVWIADAADAIERAVRMSPGTRKWVTYHAIDEALGSHPALEAWREARREWREGTALLDLWGRVISAGLDPEQMLRLAKPTVVREAAVTLGGEVPGMAAVREAAPRFRQLTEELVAAGIKPGREREALAELAKTGWRRVPPGSPEAEAWRQTFEELSRTFRLPVTTPGDLATLAARVASEDPRWLHPLPGTPEFARWLDLQRQLVRAGIRTAHSVPELASTVVASEPIRAHFVGPSLFPLGHIYGHAQLYRPGIPRTRMERAVSRVPVTLGRGALETLLRTQEERP